MAGDGGASDGPGRQWTCRVCGEPVDRIVAIAALLESRLRFWMDGYCDLHEKQVRDALEVEARGEHPPEIMVKRLLRPADVHDWMELIRREAGVA